MLFVLFLPAFVTIQTLCVNTMFIEMYDSYWLKKNLYVAEREIW